MLLITTIKNKMRGTKEETGIKNKSKKARRIRWQDQLRPSSPFFFGPAKSQGRSSLLKNRLTSPSPSVPFANSTIQQEMANNKDLELLYQSVNFKHSKVPTREKKKDS